MLSQKLMDVFLLMFTLVSSGIYVYFLSKKRELPYRLKAIAMIVMFLVLYGLLNVCAHLVAVTTVAVIKAKAGAFVYDLRFYTLIQFGILLAIINGYLLRGVNQLCETNNISMAKMGKACSLQILISLPLIPFNPLSALPVLTSIFLMLLLCTATRRKLFALNPKVQEVTLDLTSKQLAQHSRILN